MITPPSIDEIDRIARLADPILRNLQITQCYHEMSKALAGILGKSANWCTFATWASKQAGQTIRREDLLRAFQARFAVSAEISIALEELARDLKRAGARLPIGLSRESVLHALNPAAALARASDAVARGNKKVFEEIGREFARFIELFRDNDPFDRNKAARFCGALRPGDPPDGQRLLAEAFTAYDEARSRTGKQHDEQMLLANVCAGYHEQVRLQPEIAQALNATLGDPAELKERLLRLALPAFYLRARERVLRGRRLFWERLFERLIQESNRLIREVITDHLMTLRLSSTETLRLGRDLSGAFPKPLEQIGNTRLKEMLAAIDTTPESLNGSGAEDWADFADRMHFIADFFRLYQDRHDFFHPPFTGEQVTALKSGAIPSGRL